MKPQERETRTDHSSVSRISDEYSKEKSPGAPSFAPSAKGGCRLLSLALALILALLAFPVSRADAADKYRWKAVTEAQVKINDKVPLTWNIFQPDKKKDANLVLDPSRPSLAHARHQS